MSETCTHSYKLPYNNFNFVLDFFGTFCLILGTFLLALFVKKKWSIKGLIHELNLGGSFASNSLNKTLRVSLIYLVPIIMVVLAVAEVLKVLFKVGLLNT